MSDAVNTIHTLWSSYGDRILKAVFLLIAVYVALKIIGWVNGIKGTETWQVDQVNSSDKVVEEKVRLSRGTIKNGHDLSATVKEYDGRSCTVEFRKHLETPPPQWKKIFGFGQPKLLLSKDYIVEVLATSPTAQKLVSVDPATAATLATRFSGRDLDSDDEVKAILESAKFDVTAKRTNSIKFLLNHPDPTLKTTAWVLVVTFVIEAGRSVLFG